MRVLVSNGVATNTTSLELVGAAGMRPARAVRAASYQPKRTEYTGGRLLATVCQLSPRFSLT